MRNVLYLSRDEGKPKKFIKKESKKFSFFQNLPTPPPKYGKIFFTMPMMKLKSRSCVVAVLPKLVWINLEIFCVSDPPQYGINEHLGNVKHFQTMF